MSYEYFLQAHCNGKPQEISTGKILAILNAYITEKGEDYVDLQFDKENSCTIYFDANGSTVDSLMVSRPCSGKLAECLYQIMLLGNFVFLEPDGKSPIVLMAETIGHLPPGIIEAFGPPSVAADMDAFLALYPDNR